MQAADGYCFRTGGKASTGLGPFLDQDFDPVLHPALLYQIKKESSFNLVPL